jgi:hypothetical protein
LFSFKIETLKRRDAQNASKNHIRWPNRGRSSRIAIEKGLEQGGYVPRGRKAEDGRIDDRYNLVELSTSSYPARTRRNIKESDGTVIFSLERLLSGGTKLTQDYDNKLGKPVLHIYDIRKARISNPDSLRLEVQGLTDFLLFKQDRSPERGRPSGIEGARRLRVDADYVALVS